MPMFIPVLSTTLEYSRYKILILCITAVTALMYSMDRGVGGQGGYVPPPPPIFLKL